MDQITHLLLSGYVALTIVDLVRSYKQYQAHKLMTFLEPVKPYLSFFVAENKWTVGTFFVSYAIYKVFF